MKNLQKELLLFIYIHIYIFLFYFVWGDRLFVFRESEITNGRVGISAKSL